MEYGSCYFCGAAVDAPVEEYPVVPDEVDPDVGTGATVALCPSCRRKLDTVLDPVIGSVEELYDASPINAGEGSGEATVVDGGPATRAPESADEADDATTDEAGADTAPDARGVGDPDDAGRPAGAADADRTDAGTADDPLSDVSVPDPPDQDRVFGGSGESSDDDPDATAAGESPDGAAEEPLSGAATFGDPDGGPETGDASEAGGAPADGPAGSRDDPDGTPDETPEPAAGAGSPPTEPAAGSAPNESQSGAGSEPTDPDGNGESAPGDPDSREGATDATLSDGDPADGGDPTGGGDPGPAGGDDAGTGDAAGGIDTEDIPVDAYNKIVRLLKNREFPVERAEIEEIAASAYDLPRRDCELAIDAMLDRGVLVESGGRLEKGEQRT